MELSIKRLLEDLGIEDPTADELDRLAAECRDKAALFEAGRAEASRLEVALRRRAIRLRNHGGG